MDTLKDNLCAELWYECEPQLRKICQIKLQNYHDEIDDVIAETFLALCSKNDSGELPLNTKAWLYGAFGNILNAKYKELYTERENQADLLSKKRKLPFEVDFEKEMLDKLAFDDLKIKLEEKLKDEDKLLLELVFIDKMKLKDVAKRLDITESAVKQRKHRLIDKIKNIASNKK